MDDPPPTARKWVMFDALAKLMASYLSDKIALHLIPRNALLSSD
jgi:hypothetical protein